MKNSRDWADVLAKKRPFLFTNLCKCNVIRWHHEVIWLERIVANTSFAVSFVQLGQLDELESIESQRVSHDG